MNSVVLIGRMVADPELKYTPSGVAVCSFRIAVDRRFKSQNGERQADFINIVTWRQSAEYVSNYITKGQLMAVEGSLQTRKYQASDGTDRHVTEVNADNVKSLEKKDNNQGNSQMSPPDVYTPIEGNSVPVSALDYDPFSDD